MKKISSLMTVLLLCWLIVACTKQETLPPSSTPTTESTPLQLSERMDEIGVAYRIPNNFTAEKMSATQANFYAVGALPDDEKLFLTLELIPRQGMEMETMMGMMSALLNGSAETGELLTDTMSVESWQSIPMNGAEAYSADLTGTFSQKEMAGKVVLVAIDDQRIVALTGIGSPPERWTNEGATALNALRDSLEFFEPTAEFSPEGQLILPPPDELGVTRNNPLPITPVIEVPNWAITISETVRGEAAATRLNATPPDGQQYLMIHLIVTNRYPENEFPQNIDEYDFFVTGSYRLRYGSVYVSGLEMPLNTNLINGQSAEAWIAFLVGADEQSMQLVFDEAVNSDPYSERYIALDAGTKIEDDPTLAQIAPNVENTMRQNPFSAETPFISEDWQIEIKEKLRGAEAIQFLEANDAYFEPPQSEKEYYLVQIAGRYLGDSATPQLLDFNNFRLTGDLKQLYELPSVSLVDGELNRYFYPGGQAMGWVILEVGAGESNLLLAFDPDGDGPDSADYIALDQGAKIVTEFTPPAPNEVGNSADTPATADQTIITSNYELTPLELLRGEAAYQFLQTVSPYNVPLEGNLEYITMRLATHAIYQSEQPFLLDGDDFQIVASDGTRYTAPYTIAPTPSLFANLFSDGKHEGWLVMQLPQGDSQARLLFDNNTAEPNDDRYIALDWNK